MRTDEMPSEPSTLLDEHDGETSPGDSLPRRPRRLQPGLGTVVVAIGALVTVLTLAFALGQIGSGAPGGNVPVSSATGTSTPAQAVTPAAVVMIGSAPATDANDVISFVPTAVTIRAGQTVEWKWDDSSVPQNVTFAGFQSATQTTGTYFHTFESPGVFPYTSTVHFDLNGQVVVR
jgi:plastocyanin